MRSYFKDFLDRKVIQRLILKNGAIYPNLACFSRDIMASEIIIFGFFEIEYLNCVINALSSKLSDFKASTAIDIGANIGNHSVFFSSYFDRIVALEANPKTYKLLVFNTEDIPNITPINAAVGNEEKTAIFSEHLGNMGSSGIIDSTNKSSNSLEQQKGRKFSVNVENADSIVSRLDVAKIGLIKIDVEGYEYNVIMGLKEALSQDKCRMVFCDMANKFRGCHL